MVGDLIEALLIAVGDLFLPQRPRLWIRVLLILALLALLATAFVFWRNWDVLVGYFRSN